MYKFVFIALQVLPCFGVGHVVISVFVVILSWMSKVQPFVLCKILHFCKFFDFFSKIQEERKI
jgi:hypothetical protein